MLKGPAVTGSSYSEDAFDHAVTSGWRVQQFVNVYYPKRMWSAIGRWSGSVRNVGLFVLGFFH
jgi:hypothetical protein